MDLADTPNPYEFANPITRPERFAGRRSELNDIRYYLRQARSVEQPVNLALVGERAAGKTSLLNIIEHEAEQLKLLTARINLNSADGEPIRLFWKLYEAVVDSAIDAGYLFRPGSDEDRIYRSIMDGLDHTADTPNFPLRFPAHYAASVNGGRQISEVKLARDLIAIYRETKTPFVLLFDECNVLAQNRVTLEMLRNVFMSMPGYLLVLTGTPAMFPLFDEVFSPIIRQFKKIPVDPFKASEETSSCILGPLAASELKVFDIVDHPFLLSRDVHQLSGGRPYEIQLLCHFMFRRVQEGRAEKMSLTANVIDDVLRELDISASQPGSSRPLLQAVRNLKGDLSALGVLTQCDGGATLDELWFANQLSTESRHLSRQDLATHLEDFIARGILARDDAGKIRFMGDEFEKVYVSYFAESRDLSVRIENMPYSAKLGTVLNDILEAIGCPDSPISAQSEALYIEESLQALVSNDIKDLRDDTLTVHPWILGAAQSGHLNVLRLTFTYGPHTVLSWMPSPEEHIRTALSQVIGKIDMLGGALTVDELTFDVPTTENYIQRLLERSSQDMLDDLGSYHADQAGEAYLAGDPSGAWKEISFALRFPLKGVDANNVGYIHLSAGQFEEATALFDQCLQTNDIEDDNAALAAYNRAISRLGSTKSPDASDGLVEAQTLMDAIAGRRYKCRCLFVPSIIGSQCILIEQADKELSEAISEANRAFSSAEVAISAIEVKQVEWPVPES